MSRPRFLADENFRSQIVSAVLRRDRRVEFRSVVDESLSGIDDESLLEWAAQEQLILVSHDVNTLRAAALNRMGRMLLFSGLILVSQGLPTSEAAENLLLIREASEHEEWSDRIVFLPI